MVKPVLLSGVDSLTAATVRAGATCAVHWVLFASGWKMVRAQVPLRGKTLGLTVLSGWVGMGLGMTLVMLALHGGDLGLVGVLSSVTPVMVLPLLWLVQGKPPARGAWVGAVLTVVGTVLVLTRQ
nr:EamA family transporter [Curvibacter sp. CHRR-16]